MIYSNSVVDFYLVVVGDSEGGFMFVCLIFVLVSFWLFTVVIVCVWN